jgi:hypothetical protein
MWAGGKLRLELAKPDDDDRRAAEFSPGRRHLATGGRGKAALLYELTAR